MKRTVLIYTLAVTMLVLSAFNLRSYFAPQRVLGAQALNINLETEFWEDFLQDNPNYIPGWIEIGRMDKVNAIDPNYFLEP